MNRIYLFVSIIMLFIISSCGKSGYLEVNDLKCENLSNPMGIDKTIPRFSWKINSSENDTEQKSFQILVATDRKLLDENRFDIWNSGTINSANSVLVPYQGKKLISGLHLYWKIRVWDNKENVSDWSQPASFGIGLLSESDWQASYIGFNTEAGYNECPQLFKSFNIQESNSQLYLHVNSLGYHEVYLNNQKAGNGILTPAVSQFNKRSQVITYDITSLVKKGSNNLIIWLGSGWYTKGLPGVENDGPLVKAQLEKVKGDQREIILVTDSTWIGRKSSYTRHGNWHSNHFGGEIIDGKLASTDLSFENSSVRCWSPVTVVSVPKHNVSPQMVEINRIYETIKPTEIKPLGKDTFLIDMGKSLTGWTEIHFPKLQKSQEIVIEYSDHLDNNGNFVNQKQFDRYIASGEGREVFKNKFNYHAYRYIRISNLPEPPSPEMITSYLIHTGYELASGFQCSDPEINQIHDMILYTLRCLSIGGYLVDCPHIERLGYGGDGNASTLSAQTMFNLNPLYTNWLQAWNDCNRDNGDMPHTAPNPYDAGGGPYWCGFIITASWATYLNYGDVSVLERNYPVMKKWLEFVEHHTKEGILKRWPDTDYRGWYLGDWASPYGVEQTNEASVDLVNNCFISVCYDCMQKIAKVLGKSSDIGLYSLKRDLLKSRIHQTFFDKSKNSYAAGNQIDLTYPLLAGVVPDQLTEGVKDNLINKIKQTYNGHIACGLVGIPVFTEWVVKNHACDLMYSILKTKGYPGYLNMIENGATTTWEHWNGDRSRIHNCYNGIGSWFYQAVGGIRPDETTPAYKKVFIQPQIPQGITWAKTFKETPYGKLVVNWELKGEVLELDLEIPVGTEAGVILPPGINEYRINGEEFTHSENNIQTILVKSGKYKVIYSLR